ncbi:hypothetical protein [Nonomuraea sp. NPDC049141]|uniref:hypothetical protein n=1 Tax=unclassified Nonomuraea TaxID=2593643 RepID=UPI0033CB29EC
MEFPTSQLLRSRKIAKTTLTIAMALVAFGATTATANASAEDHWTYGCRGYWYGTSGHGYCKKATKSMELQIHYACQGEPDTYGFAEVAKGYEGTFDRWECTFDMTHATVTRYDA